MTNYSNASYHALQVEVRRRMRTGLNMQANYTYAKVLSDAVGDTNVRFEPFLDMENPKIERARAPFDITHAIKANFVYELPFGPGRSWNYQPLGRILGGWHLGGNMTWQSGTPFSIFSSRGTVNRGGRSTLTNTAIATQTKPELDEVVGKVFMTGDGPYFVSPSVIGADGRGAAPDGRPPFSGQVFFNPGPGELGQLQRRMFSGPWTFKLDVSVVKRTAITERQSIEFRMESFNFTNTPSFYVGDEAAASTRFNINSTTFGVLNTTFYNPRVFQFGLYYRF
jgi:hypothetical protein